jgi:chromosomal replication initiation ATPase DnaA
MRITTRAEQGMKVAQNSATFYTARAERLKRAREVLGAVARAQGVTVDEIIGKSRRPRIERARRVAMRAARRHYDQSAGRPSFPELGTVFRRNQKTVWSVCKEKSTNAIAEQTSSSPGDEKARVGNGKNAG